MAQWFFHLPNFTRSSALCFLRRKRAVKRDKMATTPANATRLYCEGVLHYQTWNSAATMLKEVTIE